MDKRDALRYRVAPLEMTPSEFRVVNFRTSLEDIEALPDIVTRIGSEIDATMR